MRIFNNFYYSFSPAIAQHVRASPYLAAMTRAFMYPLLLSLRATALGVSMLPASPEIGVLFMGILASSIIGLVSLTPVLVAVDVLRRKPRRLQR